MKKIFLFAIVSSVALAWGEVVLQRGRNAELPNDAFTAAIDVTPEPTRGGGIPGMVAWFGNGWDYGFRLSQDIGQFHI